MARPLRVEFPGALYHVTSRGNAREPVYADDADREAFLDELVETRGRFGWRLHAYCLMGNHYHLVLGTPEANLSRGMRQLNGVYTQRFNRRHQRVGHLFQGRFKAIVVEREGYLLELCRYVVLNPVRAGIVPAPEGYRWSSYRATVGVDPAPGWLDLDWLLEHFGRPHAHARRRYADFVQAGIGRPGPWSELRGQVLLGSESFAERLRAGQSGDAVSGEIPRTQRHAGRPSLEVLFEERAGWGRDQRDQAFARAHLEYGYTLAEIARVAGVHYTTVSKAVKSVGEAGREGRGDDRRAVT
jgi:REP element-mobilizing transposase RayT